MTSDMINQLQHGLPGFIEFLCQRASKIVEKNNAIWNGLNNLVPSTGSYIVWPEETYIEIMLCELHRRLNGLLHLFCL